MPYNVPADAESYKLMDVQDCFVASDKFSDLKDKVIPLEELNNYPLILISKGSNTRYSLDNYCSKLGFTLNPEMDLSSYSLVTEFAKIGMGIGIATREFLDDEIKDGSLFEVKTNPALPIRYIGVMHLKNKILNKCSSEFLDMLKNNK